MDNLQRDIISKLYLGLVHYPVKNKKGDEIVTSVTNLDIHDIARSARTFGVKKYFIITPLTAQHQLVNRILEHWKKDQSNIYNPDRYDALTTVQLSQSLDDARQEVCRQEGVDPLIAVTGANFKEYSGDAKRLKKKILLDNIPLFLLFGTGWGLSASITEQADYKLSPISGCAPDGHNHLSVRSAVAIYLDRIQGSL